MSRSRSFRILVVALVAFSALPNHAWAEDPSPSVAESNTRARNLFRQGAAAMKEGKYADARRALLEAWAIRRTYDVAAILGQAELELKLYRDAAEHLDFALSNIAPRESAEALEKIKAGLQTARQQVAELRLSSNEPTARLTVDGQPVGTTPLAGSIFVAPGTHTIEARLDDGRMATQSIEASMGSAYTIDLVIPKRDVAAPESGLGGAPAASGASDRNQASKPSLVPVFVGGGMVLLGAGVGIGYRIAASSSLEDVEALQAKTGRSGCKTGSASASDCEAQRTAGERVDTRRNVSTVGFVLAGAAALGTAVYWFWPRSRTNTVAARGSDFFVSGAPAPGGGSVVLSGSF